MIGLSTRYMPGTPVRRVHHRRQVVDDRTHRRHVLGDAVAGRGGDAEHRRTLVGAAGSQLALHLGEERGDRLGARALQPGDHHRVGVALGTADVVPEDVLHAHRLGLEGDGAVVLPHRLVGEVREAAVGGEHVAVGRLHDLVAVAGGPRRLGVDRVAERDEATDHPDALALEVLDRLGEVVVGGHRADLLGLGQLGVVADDAGLVLEVELDGVDQAAVDQVLDAGAQLVVGPRRRAHVHARATASG